MVKRFCFGPTAVSERVILPIKPRAIARELQEAKNETSASDCATIGFGAGFTEQRMEHCDWRRVDLQGTRLPDRTAIVYNAIV